MKYYLLTGMSGAGKTAALRYLEDLGAFCVDNLPPMMIPRLMELCASSDSKAPFAAFSVDVRSGAFFDGKAMQEVLGEIRQLGFSMETLFLEADDDTLMTRYKETRREHPLADERTTLAEAITKERNMLSPLREGADYLIDTTGMKTRALQRELKRIVTDTDEPDTPRLRLEVMSFGFKRGLPRQADLVLDVRFLPNPFYIPALCRHTGQDADVRDFVLNNEVTQTFLTKTEDMLSFLLPNYQEEGKHRLMIGVGCTGGQHRSVAIAEALGNWLRQSGWQAEITHRDMDLEQARWDAKPTDE